AALRVGSLVRLPTKPVRKPSTGSLAAATPGVSPAGVAFRMLRVRVCDAQGHWTASDWRWWVAAGAIEKVGRAVEPMAVRPRSGVGRDAWRAAEPGRPAATPTGTVADWEPSRRLASSIALEMSSWIADSARSKAPVTAGRALSLMSDAMDLSESLMNDSST